MSIPEHMFYNVEEEDIVVRLAAALSVFVSEFRTRCLPSTFNWNCSFPTSAERWLKTAEKLLYDTFTGRKESMVTYATSDSNSIIKIMANVRYQRKGRYPVITFTVRSYTEIGFPESNYAVQNMIDLNEPYWNPGVVYNAHASANQILHKLNKIEREYEYCCNDVEATEAVLDFRPGFLQKSLARKSEYDIKDVIFNGPATIVKWNDGSKTVVKMQDNESSYDREKGLAMAVAKKVLGTNRNKSNYYDAFKQYIKED